MFDFIVGKQTPVKIIIIETQVKKFYTDKTIQHNGYRRHYTTTTTPRNTPSNIIILKIIIRRV
jgi:hypothetical protein